MSEKLFLIIASVCTTILACGYMFVELPFVVMLILAIVPIAAAVPFFGKSK